MKTPTTEPAFRGAHLKSWRAWELACQLKASIERWLYAGGYELERRTSGGEHRVYVRFTALPGEWSLLIGECVQNTRNSLDNLVYGLAAASLDRPLTDKEAHDLAFPIAGPRPLSADRAQSSIGLLPDPVRDFIIQAQPAADPTRRPDQTKLWVLHQMSNFDKHRLIPTALVSLEGVMTTVPIAGGCSAVAPSQAIADGDWLASFHTSGELDADTIGLRCFFDVVFDDSFGPEISGVSAVTVLKDLREYVQRIHNQILGLAGYDVQIPWR